MAVARRMIHMALNIRGGIDNAKSLCGCINVDGKTLNTEQEVKRPWGGDCCPAATATTSTLKRAAKAMTWRNNDGMQGL